MSSLFLRTAVRLLLPLLFLFSLLLLFRGHDDPGGGFIGGVVAAAACSLHALAFGTEETRKMLRLRPAALLVAGLGLALASTLVGPLWGQPWFAGLWSQVVLPGLGKIGTPLFFDIGIYLVVLGAVLLMFFPLMEE